jgi:threonine/homoserine/homoserine lactone efflux protein
MTVAGAAYLTYLGVRTLRGTGRVPHGEPTAALASSPSGYLARGIGVSALNPKGLLLFLSILPQFARQSGGWPLPAQLALLGGIFVLIAAVFYLALGHTADRILGARPSIAQVTTRVAGVAMVLVGIGLLGERVIQVAH